MKSLSKSSHVLAATVVGYEVDVAAMTQTNLSSKFKRKVMRQAVSSASSLSQSPAVASSSQNQSGGIQRGTTVTLEQVLSFLGNCCDSAQS